MGEASTEPTLAVLLGASWFEHARQLAQGAPFAHSAQDFRDYLLAADGMRLPRENLHWLFDDSRSPSDQLASIGDFLRRRTHELTDAGTPVSNVIIYYVGHGLFCGGEHAYYLAIRGTNDQREGLTSLRFSDLASVIKEQSRFARRFLILDSCFSSVAYKEFQSGPLQVGRQKAMAELPSKGTTLLCSASAQDASRAPAGLGHTMFSDSLLRALRQGHRTLGPRLSFSELGDLIKVELRLAYPQDWVRPEIHSPDQREGDIADVALFPNPALRVDVTEEIAPQQVPPATTAPPAPKANPSPYESAWVPEADVERSQDTRATDSVQPLGRGSLRKRRWRLIRWLWRHPKLSLLMIVILILMIGASLSDQTPSNGFPQPISMEDAPQSPPLLDSAAPAGSGVQTANSKRPKPSKVSPPSHTLTFGDRHK